MASSYPQTFFDPPPGACHIVLVRHGQTIPYVTGQPFPTVEGHGDPVLSPRGEWQAEQVGTRLAPEPITAIYASSLTRTHQTAAPLAAARGLEPRTDRDLREVFLGEFEAGLFREKSAEGHPAVAEMRETGDWGAIPGAETNEELRVRTSAAVARIAQGHGDEMVAVFCHGGVVAALLGHAMSVSPWLFGGARNGSISHLYVTDERWFVRGWNVSDHIGPLTHDLDPQ